MVVVVAESAVCGRFVVLAEKLLPSNPEKQGIGPGGSR